MHRAQCQTVKVDKLEDHQANLDEKSWYHYIEYRSNAEQLVRYKENLLQVGSTVAVNLYQIMCLFNDASVAVKGITDGKD